MSRPVSRPIQVERMSSADKFELEARVGYRLPLIVWPYRYYNAPGEEKRLQGERFLVKSFQDIATFVKVGERVDENGNIVVFDLKGNRLGHIDIWSFELRAKVMSLK